MKSYRQYTQYTRRILVGYSSLPDRTNMNRRPDGPACAVLQGFRTSLTTAKTSVTVSACCLYRSDSEPPVSVGHIAGMKKLSRLLSLAARPEALIEIKAPVALLSALITECGDADKCVVNLHSLAARIKVSYFTLKSWALKLEALHYIERCSNGANGDIITLNPDKFPTVREVDDLLRVPVDTTGLLTSLRLVLCAAIDDGLARVRALEPGLEKEDGAVK